LTSKKTATDLLESAMIQHAGGNSAAGIVQLQDVIFLDPKMAPAWNNRGCILKQLGNNFDAMLNFDKAIEIDPTAAEFHNNRGAALSDLGQFSQAEQAYREAIRLKPKGAESLVNLGNCLKAVGKTSEALESYKRATEVKPDYADGHLNYSFALLEAAKFDQGWSEFEWRWKCGQLPPRGLDISEWTGDSLEGHSLLLYAEQGMGDALHFMRYAPMIKERFGGKIYVEVRQTLARCARSMGGIDGVIAFGEKIPDYIDRMLPMMSAPRIFGTDLSNIPAAIPYIHHDEHRASLFEKEYKKLPFKGVRVGVCWAGHNREGNPGASAIDRRRSTTLASFAPLAQVPGISWVSLQKGDPENQVMRPPAGMTVLHCMEDCEDFYDTAALVSTLDLVITVDTSVVHLVGAMGKPVWMLGRYDGCWRWMGARKDSPWYPSLTHYRQPSPGDWESVFYTVADDLRKFVRARQTPLKAVSA
jgi:tetratricopeptide (TPR) repeat protein